MAELLGARVGASDFTRYAGSFAWSYLLPFYGWMSPDYGVQEDPGGRFYGCSLGTGYVPKEDKRLRLRPTGDNDSGPYFNAVLSGYNGVSGGSKMLNKERNGDYTPYRMITHCNFRNEGYTTNGMYTYHYYSRCYCDGDTAICCGLITADHNYYRGHCFIRGFTRHRMEGPWSPTAKCKLHSWDYRLASGITEATFSFYQSKLDYLLWSILTGARSGLGIDPELTHRMYDSVVTRGEPNKVVYGDLVFQHGELTAFEWWDLTQSLEGRYRALAGQAYYDAAMALPKATTNSIATLLESAELLANVAHGNFGALVPKTPQDAWLFYRYQYTTTKLDIEEYVNVTKRLAALAAMDGIRSDGASTSNGITCHCVISADPSYIIPNSTKSWLQSYGFNLSWLNVWDMIPYSFVVDWFLHIGSFLETLEGENWAYDLPIQEAWTSFSTLGPGPQRTYFRIPGYYRAACPFLDYTSRSASGKTVLKRVLDSISLFT